MTPHPGPVPLDPVPAAGPVDPAAWQGAPGGEEAGPETCTACGTTAPGRRFRVQEMMYGSGEAFSYRQCLSCGCLAIESVPSDLGRHYPNDYYAHASRALPTGWQGLLVRMRNRHLLGHANLLGAWLARRHPYAALAALAPLRLRDDARVLDVGAGSGELLLALRHAGLYRLQGIDPFIDADRVLADELTLLRRPIEAMTGIWDVVMFHHSLEHMPDPRAALRSAHRLLAPGGYVVVRIPTVSSLAWRTYGVHWVQLDAPRHLWLHSRTSIVALAREAEFEVHTIGQDSTAFQFWGSEQYRDGIPLLTRPGQGIAPAPGRFSPQELTAFERRSREVNAAKDGDQLVVLLRRAGECA